jgi:hypothetical protein
MTITARIVDGPLMAAVVALFEVAAQRGGATALESSHDALVLQRQRVLLAVGGTVEAEDVGDLVGRPGVGGASVYDG